MNTTGKIGLGTVQFGIPYGISNKSGQTSVAEVTSILNYAKEKGIDVLDTASAYGTSEEVLGQNNLEYFNIVSKFLIQNNEQNISTQLHASLKLLNINSLYGYLAHRALDVVNNPELWDELNKFKEKGFIKKIGFSFNEINEMEAVLAAGFTPDIIQIPFNYLDNRFQTYMLDLKSKGCEIHTRSPFLQGLFFSDTSDLNPFFDEIKPILTQLQEYGNELPGMLLKHCIEKPFVDKVIFGVNTLAQLQENIKSMMNAKNLPLNERKVNESILIPSKWPNS
jgi:aryl-alcohol dehydrogenase-like predicted oxidoreductase